MKKSLKVATVTMAASLCMIGGVLCGAQSFAHASSVSVEDMKDYLISIGIPEIYLCTAEDEEIEQRYQSYYGNDVIVESSCSSLSESGESDVMPLDIITEEEMKFNVYHVLQCQYNANSVRCIKQVDVIITYDWTILPRYRRNDSILVNWDSNVFTFKADSFSSKDTRTIRQGTNQFDEVCTQTRPGTLAQGGLGYEFRLKSNASGCIRIFGSAIFNLMPAINPMLPAYTSESSYRTTSLNAEYGHSWKGVNASIGFSLDGPSISFSSTSRTDFTATSDNVFYKYL